MNNFTLKGFTLIELMIAIAIVGVLASIAVPQYTNYVVRARVSELLTHGDAAKLAVAEAFAANGITSDTVDRIPDAISKLNYSVVSTPNLSSLRINNSDGSITIMGSSVTNNTNIKLVPTVNADSSISWTCGPCGTTESMTAKQKYLPQTCVTRQGTC